MDELLKYQESVCESLEQENQRLDEIQHKYELEQALLKASQYCDKLKKIKLDMQMVRERSAQLRQKALRLAEHKLSLERERTRQLERQRLFEKHLEPVVNVSEVPCVQQDK